MPWDRERYRLEVMEPARRAGNVPPANLYLRYGLSGVAVGSAAFSARVAEVVAYWRELKTKRTYARLADTLITAHAELERTGQLTPDAFAARHADARQQQRARLDRLAEAEAGAATHVGPVTVARLRTAAGGAVSDAEVRKALTAAGVKIVDSLPELPAVPPTKYADLAQQTQVLGLRLSAEVVFGDDVRRGFRVLGGFRLADGRPLDEAAIATARGKVDALPHSDPAKTPTENVLAILRATARRPEELAALLLSEVVERLRPLAADGFMQKVIAAQAHDLGLDKDEAGIVAAAMLAGNTLEAVRRQVAEELAAGRLRSAQWLASGLPAGDALRGRVTARDAEVTALIARADQEVAAGRPEQGARLLAEATTMADDDADLTERLAELPPPSPRSATARVDGDRVLVTWQASLAQAGRPHYRVMRGQDRAPISPAEGTAVVTQTERHDVIDAEAPVGVDLYYSVFAARGGQTWSRPSSTSAVVFAPDVADVSVGADDTSVIASWRTHPGTEGVVVVRAESRPPRDEGDGTAVETSLVGFTDTGLRTGVEYYYRILASYRTPGGQRRRSAGIVVSVVPAPEPKTVDDLDARVRDGRPPVVVAAWTPPQYGQVRLVLSAEPSPWPPGARITPEDVAGFGKAVSGVPQRGGDGQVFVELTMPSGRRYLTALTGAGRRVIVGASVQIELVEPVRELSAERLHDVVRLSWVWPDAATAAVLRWPGGERRCSRRVYADEGGVSLPVGAAETTIEVCAVYTHPGGRRAAPPARVRVAGRGVAVRYRIRGAGPLRPRRRVIELTAERAGHLPALVVVQTIGPYAPDEPGEGTVVARIASQPITPDRPVTASVELPKDPKRPKGPMGTAWLACFVDPEIDTPGPEIDTPGILLFPPSADEMRVR